jgi:hypothetical protein
MHPASSARVAFISKEELAGLPGNGYLVLEKGVVSSEYRPRPRVPAVLPFGAAAWTETDAGKERFIYTARA